MTARPDRSIADDVRRQVPRAAPPIDVGLAAPLRPDRLGVAGARPGHVHLVGAGPGDPGLLTMRAAALLSTCDLVAHDCLSPDEVLDLVPAHAERICVGKTVHRRGWPQHAINELLVAEARAGRAVVRLKGGDPFVFGRGGEEAIACTRAGVPVVVVPGVSSAVAAPAAAGIPVTHRGVATGVAFVTGHEDPSKPDSQVDWEALARFHGTLVFLMGMRNLRRIADRLLSHGRSAGTPAAVVRWGTTAQQELLSGELGSIAEAAETAGITSPATIVIGDVVSLAPWMSPTSSLTPTPIDALSGAGDPA